MQDQDQLIAKLRLFAQELVDADPGERPSMPYRYDHGYDEEDVQKIAKVESLRVVAEVGRLLGRILADVQENPADLYLGGR
jgi:hypothetical protein